MPHFLGATTARLLLDAGADMRESRACSAFGATVPCGFATSRCRTKADSAIHLLVI
jgi:hypothetical protein